MNKYKSVLNEMRTILGMDPLKEESQEDTKLETEVVETEVKLAEATLEDGTIVYYDGDWALETPIFTDEAMATPLADGEYVKDNGDKFVITGGLITEIEVLEEVPAEEAPVEQKEDFEKMYNDLKGIVEEMTRQLASLKENEVQMKSQIEKLSAEPEVESISQQPQDKRELSDLEKRLNSLEAIRRLKK